MDNPQHSLDDALVEKVARALCNANFSQQGAEGEFGTVDDCWWSWRDEARAALEAAGVAELREALAYAETEARRFAGFYPEGSDGRNTFVIFADKLAALTNQGKAQG